MTVKSTLHMRLKRLREEHNFSQNDVAQQLNISRQSISQWETGKSYPDIDNLILICKLYNISIDELLDVDLTKEKEEISNSSISSKTNPILEIICLAVILTLSTQFSFFVLPVTIIIAVWLRKTKRNYIIIYVLCFICFFIGIYNIYVIYTHYIPNFGTSTITPM